MKEYKTIKMIATITYDKEKAVYVAYLGDVFSKGRTKKEAIANLEMSLFSVLNYNSKKV